MLSGFFSHIANSPYSTFPNPVRVAAGSRWPAAWAVPCACTSLAIGQQPMWWSPVSSASVSSNVPVLTAGFVTHRGESPRGPLLGGADVVDSPCHSRVLFVFMNTQICNRYEHTSQYCNFPGILCKAKARLSPCRRCRHPCFVGVTGRVVRCWLLRMRLFKISGKGCGNACAPAMFPGLLFSHMPHSLLSTLPNPVKGQQAAMACCMGRAFACSSSAIVEQQVWRSRVSNPSVSLPVPVLNAAFVTHFGESPRRSPRG